MVLRAAPSFNSLIHLTCRHNGGSAPEEPKSFVSLGSQNPESRLKLTLSVSTFHRSTVRINCISPESEGKTGGSGEDGENGDFGGKSKDESSIGGNGGENGGGNDNGGGGEGDGGGGDEEDAKFGPLLKLEDVIKKVEEKGVNLPEDMMEAAKTSGIHELFLTRYLDLQAVWPLGFLMQYCLGVRNRMLADPLFLWKVRNELLIDTCCATFAEVQKRGKDFWSEFELYLADLLVGLVVDVALVSLLAPYARFGSPSVVSNGLFGRMKLAIAALPSSVFEANKPGCCFSVKQRIASYFYNGVLYGSVGFVCGIVGQGIANAIMTAKRNKNKSEDDIPLPPLVQSAALWGVFLAISSNTRYQIVNALEHQVEKRFPSPVSDALTVSKAFSYGLRFANNVYGGMQFVDWAKLSGVQ